MKKLKAVIFFISLILAFSGCSSDTKQFDDFFEKEKQNLTNAAKELMTSLELENCEVLVYPHKSLSQKIKAKDTFYESWVGGMHAPTTPESTPADSYSDRAGVYTKRQTGVSYDQDSKREMIDGYFSILIIFEDIHTAQKEELLGILNTYIINTERGDNVTIVTKKSFHDYNEGRLLWLHSGIRTDSRSRAKTSTRQHPAPA